MRIRVVLADRYKLIRECLRAILEKKLGMEVVGEAGDDENTVRLTRELSPDIVITDVAMPGLNGVNATKQITDQFPSIKVIALSTSSNKLFVKKMLEAGASGYLLKVYTSTKDLENAINSVLRDEAYLGPMVAGVVLDDHIRHTQAKQNRTAVLTMRECEVLRLIASGKSSREIAFTLKRTIQTIHRCRWQIRDKLNIHGVAGLTRYAIREGLTTVNS